MPLSSTASQLLPLLYAAACGDKPWSEFLLGLREATNTAVVNLLCVSSDPANSPAAVRQWIQHVGFTPEILEDLAAVGEMDPWLSALTSGAYAEGWVGAGSELVSFEEVRQTKYYERIVRRWNLRPVAGVLLSKQPHELATCGLIRGESGPDCSRAELGLLRELAPHLRSAVRLAVRMGELEQNLESLQVALGQFDVGVLVIDRVKTILFASAVARRYLSAGDGLQVRNGRLAVRAGREGSALDLLLKRAILASEALSPEQAPHPVEVVALPRSGGPVLQAFVAPWLRDHDVGLRRPAAVLMILEPGRGVPRESWLRALYGLSSAEARLAVLIAGGMHGPEAARHLGLSIETVRTRLKTVFGKTGARRQAELVRLLSALPPA